MTTAAHTTRIDHDSEAGRWTLWRKPPAPALAPWIVEMQGYVETGGRPVVRRELPELFVPLIIVLDHGFTMHDPALGVRPLDRSFVAGLGGGPALIGSPGRVLCAEIDLTPAGARRLLRTDLDAIAGGVFDLDDVLGAFAETLAGRLRDLPDWPSRFDVLEAAVGERLVAGAEDCTLADAAAHAIAAVGGDLSVVALARHLGVSRKHLHQRFRRAYGLAPKAYARVTRFRRAIDRLECGDLANLADLAVACGYADQSHFNRDFRAFSGLNPTAFMRARLPDGGGILAPA